MSKSSKFIPPAVLMLAVAAGAAGAETMIVTSPSPPSHFLNTQGMEPLMACIKERTAGAVDFNFFPSGQIASVAGSYDAVRGGLAQIGLVATSAMSDSFQLNQVTMLPGMGETTPEIVAAYRKVMASGGVLAQELAKLEFKPLSVLFLPPYQVGLKGPRIDSIDDFTGKKIRASGGAQLVGLEALGAIPVQIQSGDAYVAMQQGTIDGYSFSITSVSAFKLQEVTGSISTNINLANALTFLGMDQKVFDAMPAEQQKIFEDCGLEVENTYSAYVEDLADKLEVEFKAQGVDVYEFPPELKAEVEAKLEPVGADYVKRMAELGLPGQEAYDEYRKALGK